MAKCTTVARVAQYTEQKVTASTCQAQRPLEILLSKIGILFTQLLLQNSREHGLLHACMRKENLQPNWLSST